MHHIEIKNLGPIEHCSMDVSNFMVFTGPQASGKSTIAKAIYFFRAIRGIIFDHALYRMSARNKSDYDIHQEIQKLISKRFDSLFSHNEASTQMTYTYSKEKNIFFKYTCTANGFELDYHQLIRDRISLVKDIILTATDTEQVTHIQSLLKAANLPTDQILGTAKDFISFVLNDTFGDESECVYIPAGRSIITTLTDHLSYIFASMDDRQKSNIDYCTRVYVEQVLKLKPVFSISPGKLIQKHDLPHNKSILLKAATSISEILQGYYINKSSEESIVIKTGKSIKLNYASSGQQETVWLFNILFYYLMEQKNVFIVIEEPESHLFPEAQKKIVELIGLFSRRGQNQVLLTTHSPYVLGAINNLLFASQIEEKGVDTGNIFDSDTLISNNILSSYFIANGKAVDCVDCELQLIEQAVIDGASEDINSDYERLFRLQNGNMEDI